MSPVDETARGRLRTAAGIAACALLAFGLRVAIAYRTVFAGDAVVFIETDAWYHMRLVDALVRHFPHRIWFDPYLDHPDGDVTSVGPFFDWLIAAVALVLGGGHPSERLIDLVGAFVPPVMGALTVVPVYVLGRELFSRQAGLWAAFVVATLPGNILTRSLLGYADHHCAEVLLSTVTMMWIVLAVAAGRPRRRRVFTACAGVSLGAYLLTWSGGALLVAILVTWAVEQLLIDRRRAPDTRAVAHVVVPVFAIAALMVLPWRNVGSAFAYQLLGLGVGMIAVPLLSTLAAATRELPRAFAVYWTSLLAAGVGGLLLVWWIAPSLALSAWHEVQRFSLDRSNVLAAEALPLMRSADRLPFPLWNQFTTSLFVAAAALAAIGANAVRRPSGPRVLLLTWTAAMALATVGQVRFAYYLGVNVALCAGFGCSVLMAAVSRAPLSRWGAVVRAVAVAGLAATLTLPALGKHRTSAQLSRGPSTPWIDALRWMRTNTPEPFGDPDWYYRPQAPAASTSAYGVVTSWDKGYEIIRIGRRPPVANPRQTGARESAQVLLAETESDAVSAADRLRARYVIVGSNLQARLLTDGPIAVGYLANLAASLGEPLDRYVRLAYRQTAGERVPVLLYEPAYYRALMTRLYRSDVERSAPRVQPWVVRLSERRDGASRTWDILSQIPFNDVERAEAYVAAAASPDVRLVGFDPLISCVPVPPLREFTRVYRSLERESLRGPTVVQIYERVAR